MPVRQHIFETIFLYILYVISKGYIIHSKAGHDTFSIYNYSWVVKDVKSAICAECAALDLL